MLNRFACDPLRAEIFSSMSLHLQVEYIPKASTVECEPIHLIDTLNRYPQLITSINTLSRPFSKMEAENSNKGPTSSSNPQKNTKI